MFIFVHSLFFLSCGCLSKQTRDKKKIRRNLLEISGFEEQTKQNKAKIEDAEESPAHTHFFFLVTKKNRKAPWIPAVSLIFFSSRCCCYNCMGINYFNSFILLLLLLLCLLSLTCMMDDFLFKISIFFFVIFFLLFLQFLLKL